MAPYVDDKVQAGARELGLPAGADELARLAGAHLVQLAAGLVRVTLTKNAAAEVRQAAQDRG